MAKRTKSSELRDGIVNMSEETDGGLSGMSTRKLVDMTRNTRSAQLTNAAVNLIRRDGSEMTSAFAYEMIDGITDIAKYTIKNSKDEFGKQLVMGFISMASSIDDINAKSKIVTGTGRMVYELSIKGHKSELIRDVMLFATRTYESGIRAHREDDAARVAQAIPTLARTMEKPSESMRVVKAVLDSLKSDFDSNNSSAAASAR